MHPQMKVLQNLTPAEKLQLVEELWDDLATSDEPLPLPAWHEVEANRRVAELDANPSIAIDRDELWRRVARRNG